MSLPQHNMRPRRSFLSTLSSYLKVLPWHLWLCFPKSIRSSIYLCLEKWYGVGEWSVWHLPFGLILKHTQDRPPEIEANNIKFVRENTTIPVPRILDVLPDIPTGTKYPDGLILMTEIKGITLAQWLRAKTTYPLESDHYKVLIFGPPPTSAADVVSESYPILWNPSTDLSSISQIVRSSLPT
ncbi:uncharacterized protein EV420DRAFT_702587 [Desarmillaria tabescens]|uniref:Uncharacterized protein n=1 Tax=Armillaria tabescens TaxID=1929756 RepID=A0AA39MYX2_ARMTA|nr:uncharacterized protein EV420DRAFT_702587 [Desarmillaria tabescens]KAK0452011.1 hypothetical protein EV420DRAFT_702587 [Desarmillaria tabescens]